jgi:hypothetical protein
VVRREENLPTLSLPAVRHWSDRWGGRGFESAAKLIRACTRGTEPGARRRSEVGMAPAGCGADDGNRTRVSSLGSCYGKPIGLRYPESLPQRPTEVRGLAQVNPGQADKPRNKRGLLGNRFGVSVSCEGALATAVAAVT